jgi:hypothetical protein
LINVSDKPFTCAGIQKEIAFLVVPLEIGLANKNLKVKLKIRNQIWTRDT